MTDGHWVRWHDAYDDPSSTLSRRLTLIQHGLRDAVNRSAPGRLRLLSMCAGQGRDVIGVLGGHTRADDVSACLVEADQVLVDRARALADRAGLSNVEVIEGDAGTSSAYNSCVPADIVLICGVFGNVSDDDIRRTITQLPRLCAAGAHVIWTRHRRPPDRTPAIREWFEDSRFEELDFESDGVDGFGIGVHRFAGEPLPHRPGVNLFTFSSGHGDPPSRATPDGGVHAVRRSFSVVSADALIPDGLTSLAGHAGEEGLRIVSTVLQRWSDGSERYGEHGEAILAATSGGDAVGIGGLTRCPHVGHALRVRRFYVAPDWRRRGVARALATNLIVAGFGHTDVITCNAGASAAAPPFWESMGFVPTEADGITHILRR